MRIALSGGRSPLALFLAKKFTETGHEVYMLEHFSPTFASHSQYVKEVYLLPSPAYNWLDFRSELLTLLKEKEISLLVPVNEETLYYSQLQDEIQQLGVRFLIGDHDLVTTLHNKWDFVQWCQSIGLKVPHTEKYKGQEVDFRLNLIKPEFSRFGQGVCLSAKEFADTKGNHAYLVQEKLEGQQICVSLMLKEGRLVSYSAYDTNLGIESFASITFQPFSHPDLDQIVTKLVAHLGSNGIYGFDFFYDGKNFYPIECNPRLTFGSLIDGQALIANLLAEEVILSSINPPQVFYGIKLLWAWKIVTKSKWRTSFVLYREAQDVLTEVFGIQNWVMLPWVLMSYYLKGRQLNLSMTEFVVSDIAYPAPRDFRDEFLF